MGLRDIGGGFQVIDAQKIFGNQGDQLSTLLQLRQLANEDPEARALEKQKLQLDVTLKKNEVDNLTIQDAKLKADLLAKTNSELRAQSEFFTSQVKAWVDLAREQPGVAQNVISQVIPGATARQNEDGTLMATVPTFDPVSNRTKNTQFFLDPKKVASPEKRFEFEKGFRSEYQKFANQFGEISNQFKNVRDLKDLATGAADIGIIFAYNKVLDPGGRVTEGEILTAQNAPSLSESLRNRYNKAMTDGGPIFGEQGSKSREDFVDAINILYETKRDDFLQSARGIHAIASQGGLNADNAIVPVGGFTVDQILGREPLPELSGGQDVKPSDAQIIEESGGGEVTPPKEINVFDLFNQKLGE